MKLSTGHYIQIVKSGTRKNYPAHTLHLVNFWVSQEDFEAGKLPCHTEDFETQWHSPHPDPLLRMKRILEQYVTHMSGGKLLPAHHWSDLSDTHGNLAGIE